MKPAFCVNCGAPAEQWHHVVPKSLGGVAQVPLCCACHSAIHGVQFGVSTMTSAALAVKRGRGEKLGGELPYGFRVGADGVHLEPNPDEQHMKLTARELRAEGLSLRAIGAALEERGLLPRSGRQWHAETVRALLRGDDAKSERGSRP